MSKAKPILKWVKRNGEWRAGPLVLERDMTNGQRWFIRRPKWCPLYEHDLDRMKRAVERLASRIIAATKRKSANAKP